MIPPSLQPDQGLRSQWTAGHDVCDKRQLMRAFSLIGHRLTFVIVFCIAAFSSSAIGPATVHAARLVPIYAIQGDGPASLLVDQWVDTYGLVTGVVADGFYLQDPYGDDNPDTSDGIFVYTRQAPTVQVGQCIEVQRGYVDEFYEKTELSRIKATIPSTLCPNLPLIIPTIPTAKLTQDPAIQFEHFEGMVVALSWAGGHCPRTNQAFCRWRDGSGIAGKEPSAISGRRSGLSK